MGKLTQVPFETWAVFEEIWYVGLYFFIGCLNYLSYPTNATEMGHITEAMQATNKETEPELTVMGYKTMKKVTLRHTKHLIKHFVPQFYSG